MPIVSMFYGIIVRMYFFDNQQHALPHVHAEYAEHSAVFSLADGTLLAGSLPTRQTKLVQAWLELRQEELMADWQLALNGESIFRIDPLR